MKYILILTVVLLTATASAQIYSWQDKNGMVHMSTSPPPNSSKDVRIMGNEAGGSRPDGGDSAEEAGSSASPRGVFLNKLYTLESIETEKARLTASIEYNRGACKTQKRPPTQTQDFWDNYCEDTANRAQKSLDVLTSDHDRYFYVVDQINRKAKGDYVDNPPLYPRWH